MSGGITISGCLLQQPVRESRLGTWHLAAGPGGDPAGILLVRPDAAVDLLATCTSALLAAELPGVLRVRDLVSKHGRVWLVVDDAPAPTLADLLAGAPQGAGNAMHLLAALGDTLIALHARGIAHGDMSAATVVVRPGGAPLLADWGAVADPAPAADTSGWAALVQQLAAAWCGGDPAAAALLDRVAGLAASTGDLRGALAELHTGIAGQQVNRDSATMMGQQPLTAALQFAAQPADPTVVLGSTGSAQAVPAEPGGSLPPDPGQSLLPPADPAAGTADPPEGLAGTELGSEPAAAAAAAVAAMSTPATPSASASPSPRPSASGGSAGGGVSRPSRSSSSSGAPGASGSMPGTVSRFGPGLPASGAQRAWRRGSRPTTRPTTGKFTRYARSVGSLLVLVAIAVAVLWWTQRSAVDVTGVEVRVDAASGCGGTTHLVGVISTNGEPGTISYRWVRSDTGPGPLLEQKVGTEKEARVALEWTIQGQGALTARAELEILAPRPLKGVGQFTYTCA